MATLSGFLERTIYRNDETYFMVGRIRCDDGMTHTFTCTIPQVSENERLRMDGEWVETKYGSQFKVASYEVIAPTTRAGILRFLSSGLIKQIGPATADKIVAMFGENSLDIIDREPDRLVEIPGISAKKAVIISASYQERRTVAKVMAFLQGYNIGPGTAARICQKYGNDATTVVKSNPFRLVEEIHGIGFRTADRIAAAVGIALDSPQRIRAAILYCLEQGQQAGHVFLPTGELFSQVIGICAPTSPCIDLLSAQLHALTSSAQIILEQDEVHIEIAYLSSLYNAEKFTAEKLLSLSCELIKFSETQIPSTLLDILSADQACAVNRAHESGVLVITGGPGTGKTTTLKTLVNLLCAQGLDVVLAAPTGRAAKRMSEAVGKPAKTVHRLLEYTPNGEAGRFQRNASNPLDGDAIIIDEASMMDIVLFSDFLRAIRQGCRLIIVGDVDQLPSVGAGNVLRDIIASGIVPVARLTQVFRQANTSAIIQSAHLINAGTMPITDSPRSDFCYIDQKDPEVAAELIIDLCARRLPLYRGKDPLDDIQVITPMRNGTLGVQNFNTQLQARINPPSLQKAEVRYGKTVFRIGDKVMQTRNNYQKEIFNGDIGRVTTFNVADMTMFVRYTDAREVEYHLPRDLDELILAYAITVHKSQGSEYPVVIVPISTQHYIMLQRNLLYTAITRAKELVVVVGEKKALAIAIKNNEVRARHSRLEKRLHGTAVQ